MKTRARAAFAALGALALASCVPEPEVSVVLEMPASAGAAAWFEVGAVRGACPDAAALRGGVPLGDGVARIAFAADADHAPTFGALTRERWAFVAAARDASCGVIAIGCKGVDLSGSREVSITLLSLGEPREGTCAPGLVCQYAHCIDMPASSTPSASGCSLTVRGGGALVDPLSTDVATAMIAAAPAIAPTATGFFASAIDATASGDRLRASLRHLDGSGASTALASPAFIACAGPPSLGGVAIAEAPAGKAFEVRSGPSCNDAGASVSELSLSGTRALYTDTSRTLGSTLHPHSLVRESASGRMYVASTSLQSLAIHAATSGGVGPVVSGIPSDVTDLVDMAASGGKTLWLGRASSGKTVAGVIANGVSAPVTVSTDARAVAAHGPSAFAIASIDAAGFVHVDRLSDAGVGLGSFEFGNPGGAPATDASIVTSGEFMIVALGTRGEIWSTARSIHDDAMAPSAWKRLSDAVPLARRRRDGALTLAASGDVLGLTWLTSARPTPDDLPFGYAVIGCESRAP